LLTQFWAVLATKNSNFCKLGRTGKKQGKMVASNVGRYIYIGKGKMVASNVGRYIYIGKGKLQLSFLKHALEERSYNGFKQPGRALYSVHGDCPSTSAEQ
jgi:hypothetical protein